MTERNVAEALADEGAVICTPDGQRLVFPGCHAKRVSAAEIETYEGRFEYWDGPTETMIVADDDANIVSADHELPAQYLAQLTQQLADECGAHFMAFGTTSIWRPRRRGPLRGHFAARSVHLLASARGLAAGSPRAEVGRSLPAGRGFGSGSHYGYSGGASCKSIRHGGSRSCGWRCRRRSRRIAVWVRPG